MNYSYTTYKSHDTNCSLKFSNTTSKSYVFTKNYRPPSVATTSTKFGGHRMHSQTLAYYAHINYNQNIQVVMHWNYDTKPQQYNANWKPQPRPQQFIN